MTRTLPSDAPSRVSPTLVGVLVSGVALGLGAGSSVTDRDAGELTTAAFRLDVAHPSGFPLDMALLRTGELLPLGDVAFRANLTVAALTAVACGLLTRLAWHLGRDIPVFGRWPLALLPAAALVCSSTVLRAATATEVYASTLAAAAMAFTLTYIPPTEGVTPVGASAGARRRLAALLAGASLALHTTSRPAPLLALAVLGWEGLRAAPSLARALRRQMLAAVPLALSGAAVIGWLPVAARRHGPIDWGNPTTPAALWRHLSAQSIRAAFAPRMMVPWRMPEDTGRVVGNLVQDLGLPLLLVALGGVLLAVRDRLARMLAVVAAVDVLFAVAIHPMGTFDRQTLFIAELALSLLAACALGRLAGVRGSWASRVAGAMAAGLWLTTVVRCDRTWAAAADGWAESELLGGPGALGAVPLRAVVLCGSDDFCGGAFYAQWVEGERPDVSVLFRQNLDDPNEWRRLTAHRLGVAIPPPLGTGDLRLRRLRGLVTTLPDRVRWENPESDDARVLGVQTGSGETPVLARVTGPVTIVDAAVVPWVAARLPSTVPTVTGAGARWLASMVVFGAARRVARAGISQAVPLWSWTVALEPQHGPSFTNLGVAAARVGRYPEAIALTRHALDLDPERSMAWRNLGDYLAATGDPAGAAVARAEARRRTE